MITAAIHDVCQQEYEEYEHHNECVLSAASTTKITATITTTLQSFLYTFDQLVSPIYILLAFSALSTLFVSSLRNLSLHGKLMKQKMGNSRSNSDYDKSASPPGWLRYSFQIPKRFFAHFYIMGIASTAALMLALHSNSTRHDDYNNSTMNIPSGSTSTSTTIPTSSSSSIIIIATALLLIHLYRRFHECRYVHVWGDSTMHFAGYIVGMLHYTMLPMVFLLDELFLLSEDGCNNGAAAAAATCHNDNNDSVVRNSSSGGSWIVMRLITGVLLNISSQWVQHQHHVILANLRRRQETEPPTNDKHKSNHQLIDQNNRYVMPTGGWFNYISCPHYLAEIMLYASFVILLLPRKKLRCCFTSQAHRQPPPLLFSLLVVVPASVTDLLEVLSDYKPVVLLIWVVINLSISASRNHAWYVRQRQQQQNSEIAATKNTTTTNNNNELLHFRKALVPFIW